MNTDKMMVIAVYILIGLASICVVEIGIKLVMRDCS